ncbi:hypothetical protein [Microbacterium sp. PAMC21962]|uniref:hypothetical protein n=1 Tax=Microbacterium sp. PAMC21962 TaxID=2861280 RepID=UPI001C634D68|nr:hypothetical protein [Microbacterium sp. PAMC21962]QYF98128.1 hypothetical protein KY498_02405 [Microbacterium sp. PAMC21962]
MSAAPMSLTRVVLAGAVVVANAAAQAALVAVAPRQPLDAAAIASPSSPVWSSVRRRPRCG